MQGLTGSLSNFPMGWSNGVNIRGLPMLNAYSGQVLWLGNSTNVPSGCSAGDDGNPGTYQRPFSTLQGAVTASTAGIGTIIAVKPGHAETISTATALTMSISDTTVVGMGQGVDAPLFTLGTATTATINVTANNVGFVNCQFTSALANVASLFTLTTAKGFSVDGCWIYDTSAILNFLAIITTATTSNVADRMSVTNSNINLLVTSGACPFISALGTNDSWNITGNVYKATTTGTGAWLPIATGKILTNLLIDSNRISLQQTQSLATGILITTNGSTNTGWLTRNLIQALDDTTEILVTASSGFKFSQNYYSGVADASGYLLPAADS